MSKLNISPVALAVAGVAALLLLSRRQTAVVTTAQPTTNQNYALWQQLGLPQIANQLITATIGRATAAPAVSPTWQASYWNASMGNASTPAQQAAQAQQFFLDNPFAAVLD